MAEHLRSGRTAERIARRFLETQGLQLLATNYNCRFGELDLVMQNRRSLVVIEIRYRRNRSFMTPAESIGAAKRKKIAQATMHYIQNNRRYRRRPVRFDVVSLSGPLDDSRIDWIPGAFTVDDLYNI